MRVELCCVLLLMGVLSSACTVHTALKPSERFVHYAEPIVGSPGGEESAVLETPVWRSARSEDLEGTFTLVEIRGAAAASVLQVTYHFDRAGHYTGSALITGREGPRFQTISGDWQLRDGTLRLGRGSPPAAARVRGRRLELGTDLGTVVLER